MCQQIGVVSEATQVDHIVPLAEDWNRRLDPTNTQSLCRSCHATHKQRQEQSGRVVGNDAAGEPLNEHAAWWNR